MAHGAPQRVRLRWTGNESVVVIGGHTPTIAEKVVNKLSSFPIFLVVQ
jgi:hypothetical protein